MSSGSLYLCILWRSPRPEMRRRCDKESSWVSWFSEPMILCARCCMESSFLSWVSPALFVVVLWDRSGLGMYIRVQGLSVYGPCGWNKIILYYFTFEMVNSPLSRLVQLKVVCLKVMFSPEYRMRPIKRPSKCRVWRSVFRKEEHITIKRNCTQTFAGPCGRGGSYTFGVRCVPYMCLYGGVGR